MVVALDTNIVVDLLRKKNEAPRKILAYSELYLPMPVCGELLYGAAISAKPIESRQDVMLFLGKCKLLDFD